MQYYNNVVVKIFNHVVIKFVDEKEINIKCLWKITYFFNKVKTIKHMCSKLDKGLYIIYMSYGKKKNNNNDSYSYTIYFHHTYLLLLHFIVMVFPNVLDNTFF